MTKHANDNINYFGGCPHCLKNDGYLNVGREQWFVCHRHKTKWSFGRNVFTVLDDDETLQVNVYRLANYMTCEPVVPIGPPIRRRLTEECPF